MNSIYKEITHNYKGYEIVKSFYDDGTHFYIIPCSKIPFSQYGSLGGHYPTLKAAKQQIDRYIALH